MNTVAEKMLVARNLEQDMSMMEAYIDATHPNLPSNRIPFAEYLLNWEEAKERGGLFKLFDGKNIITRKVSYIRSVDEIEAEMDNNKFDSIYRNLRAAIYNTTAEVFHTVFGMQDFEAEHLARVADCYMNVKYSVQCVHGDYIWDQCPRIFGEYPCARDFFFAMGIFQDQIWRVSTWVENALMHEYWIDSGEGKNVSLRLPDAKKSYRLVYGQKPIRAMMNMVKYLREYTAGDSKFYTLSLYLDNMECAIERMRQFASMLTNQAKLEGILSISIHPFDYMTMSEPENGWTSCMAWCPPNDGGEYHAGTLEMMTSPCVVVAYLESKDKIHPAGINYEWNKKKWRELFIIDHNFISGIKGYPYYNRDLENSVFSILNELAKRNWGVEYNLNNIMPSKRNMFEVNGESFAFQTQFMYNDCESNTYNMVFNSNVKGTTLNDRHRNNDRHSSYAYGEACYCIACGQKRDVENEDNGENMIICCSCDNSTICDSCDRRCYEGEYHTLPDGCVVCDDCYENMVSSCDYCGKDTLENYQYDIQFRYTVYGAFHSNSVMMCSDCMKKLIDNGNIYHRYDRYVRKMDEKLWQIFYNTVVIYLSEDECKNLKYCGEWTGSGNPPITFTRF